MNSKATRATPTTLDAFLLCLLADGVEVVVLRCDPGQATATALRGSESATLTDVKEDEVRGIVRELASASRMAVSDHGPQEGGFQFLSAEGLLHSIQVSGRPLDQNGVGAMRANLGEPYLMPDDVTLKPVL